ncbi:mitochondrial [Lecanosticta acicola]|uniref:GrpE protein homolog n=1 Tax=Lecanosticta acicola TaxID=111012 RepID=A0AAI8Z4B3_9PEZI|nr:mitochondrial [Lecanosticta acicola]
MLQQRFARSLQSLARQPQTLRAWRVTSTPFSASKFRVAPIASQQVPSRRWYSSKEESEKKEEEMLKEESEGNKAQEGDAAKDDPVQKELEAKKKEVLDLTDRLKRQVADYRNLQEQTKREVAAARDFALQKFAKDLLDSVDNLDRALGNVPVEKLTDDNKELKDLYNGLRMTEDILMKTLKKHGMERIDPSVEGEVFNPNVHEATFQAPQPDKKDGTVFYTQQKGFLYNGRVLRAAKVGVVKNS